MQIRISGTKSKELRAKIRESVKFGAEYFFDKRVLKNLSIHIIFENLTKYGALAEMEVLEHDTYYPREFQISLNKRQSHFTHVLCILHEMVHVKQYARAELIQSARNFRLHKFKGDWVDTGKVNYWDCPWEIEAHGREKGMMLKYINTSLVLSEDDKKKWKAKFNLTY
jgi:hypothetical protein